MNMRTKMSSWGLVSVQFGVVVHLMILILVISRFREVWRGMEIDSLFLAGPDAWSLGCIALGFFGTGFFAQKSFVHDTRPWLPIIGTVLSFTPLPWFIMLFNICWKLSGI